LNLVDVLDRLEVLPAKRTVGSVEQHVETVDILWRRIFAAASDGWTRMVPKARVRSDDDALEVVIGGI
jgi:hypothetical protein